VKKRSQRFLAPKHTSRIVLATSNDDSSAQNRPRDLKVVPLEPSRNEDAEYVFQIVIACLLKKWQCKMSGNTIFQSLFGGGGSLWDKLVHRVAEMATVNVMKMIDYSLPSVTHIRVTLLDFFLHISP
jgi:hypothetical protein